LRKLRDNQLNFGKCAGICVNLMTVVIVAGLKWSDSLLTSKSAAIEDGLQGLLRLSLLP
jgi:hypothetical protein